MQPVEEPAFLTTQIVEPSLSDAVSSDPFATGRGAVLALWATPNLVKREDETIEDALVWENPQSDTSSPRPKETTVDVTRSCFDLPLEPSLLIPYCHIGDIRESAQEMAHCMIDPEQVLPPFCI